MVFSTAFFLLFAVSLLLSAIGFKHYIWFFSIGYGLSIAGLGVLLPLLFGGRMSAGTVLCCLLFVVYGLRLGGYLAYRELKVRSYSENMKGEIKDSKKIPVFVKVCIWTAYGGTRTQTKTLPSTTSSTSPPVPSTPPVSTPSVRCTSTSSSSRTTI